ncbi:DUF1223 domain-containing protein [Marinicellulosiphila megalodicopiae]|uniref:DUF1223 domain-containing protein n=1 Tax=Marinicellulosiphila megalodicopiae TaxID=2724896 RepID=UPI003BB1DDAF
MRSLPLILVLFISFNCFSKTIFESGTQKTQLLQLFTSEGCSSCPLADKWLSTQKSNPELFKSFIPMAFHVDYWDRLGWKDTYSQSKFTDRQRLLKSQGLIKSVYTPGIIFEDKEFRQWFKGNGTITTTNQAAKKLMATIENDVLIVNYDSDQTDLVVNIAYLKMNEVVDINRGENSGKQLKHDFVVLEMMQVRYKKNTPIILDFLTEGKNKDTALSIWITKDNRLENLQAVGGYL